MANLKSSQKDVRRIARRTERNRAARSKLRTLRKKVLDAAKAGDAGKIREAAIALVSAFDKAAKTQVVHRNAADRAKAAMAKYLNPPAPVSA